MPAKFVSSWQPTADRGSAGCYQLKRSSKQVYFNKHAIGATNPSAEVVCGMMLDEGASIVFVRTRKATIMLGRARALFLCGRCMRLGVYLRAELGQFPLRRHRSRAWKHARKASLPGRRLKSSSSVCRWMRWHRAPIFSRSSWPR